jgi:hypothetical protein
MATIPGGLAEQLFSNFTQACLEWAQAQYFRQLKNSSPAVLRQRSVKEQNRGHPGPVYQDGSRPLRRTCWNQALEAGMAGALRAASLAMTTAEAFYAEVKEPVGAPQPVPSTAHPIWALPARAHLMHQEG